MPVTLTLTRKTPGQTQFGLDTFTEHYKCDATADVVLTDPSVPQIGAAHPDYPFMFITNRYCTETSESASALDLVYMGVLSGGRQINLNAPGVDYVVADELVITLGGEIAGITVDSIGGGGEIVTFHVTFNNFTESLSALPAVNIAGSGLGSGATFDVDSTSLALPAKKQTKGGQISSATTNTTSVIWPVVLTNPISATFYAITSTLSYVSNDPADASEPDDPAEITNLITYDLGFGASVPGSSSPEIVALILSEAFLQYISEAPPNIDPIVNGQFWQITKTKTRTLLPWAPPA